MQEVDQKPLDDMWEEWSLNLDRLNTSALSSNRPPMDKIGLLRSFGESLKAMGWTGESARASSSASDELLLAMEDLEILRARHLDPIMESLERQISNSSTRIMDDMNKPLAESVARAAQRFFSLKTKRDRLARKYEVDPFAEGDEVE